MFMLYGHSDAIDIFLRSVVVVRNVLLKPLQIHATATKRSDFVGHVEEHVIVLRKLLSSVSLDHFSWNVHREALELNPIKDKSLVRYDRSFLPVLTLVTNVHDNLAVSAYVVSAILGDLQGSVTALTSTPNEHQY